MTIITQNTSTSSPKEVKLYVDNSPNVVNPVVLDGLLRGDGGRKHVLYAASNAANPVVKVQDNGDNTVNPYVRSALIENLIIDGQDHGVTGILLENVVHCQIRNITIKNCDVGIHIRSYNGYWSECTSLKHIRMENVKKGIVFTTTGRVSEAQPGDSAAFTVIDDVGIKLVDNDSSAVGIQVGGTQLPGDIESCLMKPYSARIKANVWLGSAGGTGLRIAKNGQLFYGQSQLTVTRESYGTGTGIKIEPFPKTATISDPDYPINHDEAIWKQQFSNGGYPNGGFMLVTSNITTQIDNQTSYSTANIADIKLKSFV